MERETAPVAKASEGVGLGEYRAARARFLEACASAGTRVSSTEHPEPGPEGEPLYLDVAELGAPDGGLVVVLASGTHGIEGHAGSWIQRRLLHELRRSGLVSALEARDARLVLLHGVNPWGFAFGRRTDSSNVDVNRNFLDDFRSLPSNEAYEELADTIAPRVWSAETPTATRQRFRAFRSDHGTERLDTAIMAGQYSHPNGLFFGGHCASWSNRTLRRALVERLKQARRVAFLDLHTGLGPNGRVTIVSNASTRARSWRTASRWWGPSVTTTTQGRTISPHLVGSMKLALPGVLAHAEVVAVTVEFGTLKASAVFEALQAENWLHHYGTPDSAHRATIERMMRDAFNPPCGQWRGKVWQETLFALNPVFRDLFNASLV